MEGGQRVESVSFSCSFEAGRNAGASPASREAVPADVPFLEAMEKALPGEPPGSVPAGREAGGTNRLPGSRTTIFLNDPLSFGISERTPQTVPSQAAQEGLSPKGDLFGSGKTAILLETLQALRHQEKLGLPESLEEEPLREPGRNEADPGNVPPPSPSGKEGSEKFSPCSPSCGPRILPLAVSEQQSVSEEPKADPSVAENFLVTPLNPNAAGDCARGSSPFPVKERACCRGQNGRLGTQEEKTESGESQGDDRTLPAFQEAGPLQLRIEPFSTREGPVTLADSSMPPSVSLAAGSTRLEILHGRNSQAGNRSDGLTEALRNELPLDVNLRREAFLPAGRFLEQIPLQGTGEENVLRREGASLRLLDVLIPGQTVRPKEEHRGDRLTLQKLNGILPASPEEGKRDIQGKSVPPLTEGMLTSGDFPMGQTAQAGPGTPDISTKAAALETGIAKMTAYLSSSKGRQRGVIRLHPPELGDVRVVLFSAGERVRLSLTVESPDVREMVVKSEESLREGLRQQGIHLGEMTVDVNGEPGQGFGAPNPERERTLPALAEDGFSEAGPEEAEARIDLVNGLFSWVA